MDKHSDLKNTNIVAIIAHFSNVFLLTGFTLFVAIKGGMGVLRPSIMLALGFIPVVAEIIVYSRNHDTELIKHFLAVGYAVFYTYTLMTTTNHMVFVFVIPMILMVVMFNDQKYILLVNIGVIILNGIAVIGGYFTGRFGFTDINVGILQLVAVVMVAVNSFLSARMLSQSNAKKLDNVERAQKEAEQALNNISVISEQLKAGIEDIDKGLDRLVDISRVTEQAMNEVSNGASDTANAVEQQMYQTEAIQEKVEKVNQAAFGITENMKETAGAIDDGSGNVRILMEKTNISVQNGEDVTEKLKSLEGYMTQMQSIVGLIGGITSQTSLLALNASIEAARAGDAGRGFAVVATEISGMATQTQEATVNITGLIENVSDAIHEVVQVIYKMIEGINEGKDSTERTVESFKRIQENSHQISNNIDNLFDSVTELKNANKGIVDSIQTISAISEEVTARSAETMDAEASNMEELKNIKERMQKLLELTKK